MLENYVDIIFLLLPEIVLVAITILHVLENATTHNISQLIMSFKKQEIFSDYPFSLL